MILWTILIGLLLFLFFKLNKNYHVLALFSKRIKTSDGTPLEHVVATSKGGIFGNSFDLFGRTPVDIWNHAREMAKRYKKSYIEYTLGFTVYNIITAEDAELVFNDQNLITKSVVYNFLMPFLRSGLLISSDKKWHSRRKMLTPTFHFNILSEFVTIFKEESQKFVDILKEKPENVVSLSETIPRFTLNSVCETALGVKLDDQLDGDEYRKSFKCIEDAFIVRISHSYYFYDSIWNFFKGAEMKPHIKSIHDFSSRIIEKRRQIFTQSQNRVEEQNIESDDVFKKKRYAMLDTLLKAESEGLIDHLGICEEVDTFMFEGFDTTSMALIFGLMNMALHPDLQERCYAEIEENIDDDLSKLEILQLNKLKYLDCFVKETLRLYPSVPIIGRKTVRDITLANKLVLPAGTQITIHIFDILRNEKYFSEPDMFDPERFTVENSVGRHPFAFVPFSAGQRNCIGQKFAMLEIKTLMVYMLKNFILKSVTNPTDFGFESGIIIRSQNNVKVKLIKRNKT